MNKLHTTKVRENAGEFYQICKFARVLLERANVWLWTMSPNHSSPNNRQRCQEAIDLIDKLVVPGPDGRLGARTGGIKALKALLSWI